MINKVVKLSAVGGEFLYALNNLSTKLKTINNCILTFCQSQQSIKLVILL